MTVKEKEENFYQMAIDSATAQNVAIVNEYKEQLNKETKMYQEQVEETLRAREKYEMEQMQREMNTAIAMKSLEIRHDYAELSLTLKEELFEEVLDEITSYCKTESYQKNLQSQIRSALAMVPGQECIITVVERDFNFVFEQFNKDNITVKKSDEDFWGGFKAEFTKKQMIVNQTYEMKFRECKRNFKFHPKN